MNDSIDLFLNYLAWIVIIFSELIQKKALYIYTTLPYHERFLVNTYGNLSLAPQENTISVTNEKFRIL